MEKYLAFVGLLAVLCVFHNDAASLSRVERATTPSIKDFIGDTGISANGTDVIFVVDRSTGMGKETFYLDMKPLLRSLLTKYTLIHEDYVRLAFITFAKEAKTNFDYISNTTISKCELLPDQTKAGDPWHDLLYFEDETAPGTNIPEAFHLARDILAKGRINRPWAQQLIVILTDGDYTPDEDPFQDLKLLKDQGVKIYGVGIGGWLKPGNVRILCTQPEYFGLFDDWETMVRDTPRNIEQDTLPLLTKLSNDMCASSSCQGTAACYCDVISGMTTCQCPEGHGYGSSATTCSECNKDYYKSDVGNFQCSACPQTAVTPFSGSTTKGQCTCASPPCQDACDSNPCTGNSRCISTSSGHTCECKEGWSGTDCNTNVNDCKQDSCRNRGTCVDGLGQFTCICPWGYAGRYCEVDLDECAVPDLCVNGGVCQDKRNNFECQCTKPYIGLFCQDMEATTTTTTTTPKPCENCTSTSSSTTRKATTSGTSSQRPSSISNGDDTDNKDLLMIIIPSAVGGLILIIIIIVIAVILSRRKEKKTDNSNIVQRPSSIKFTPKTISQAFSGFWRSKTVRGDAFDKQGAPSAPPRRRPDLLINNPESMVEAENVVEEAVLDNQQIELSAMDGWTSYLKDLETSGVVTYGCIMRTDAKKRAVTSQFKYSKDELKRIEDILDEGQANVPARVQSVEFHIFDNDGDFALGKTIGSSTMPECLVLSRTKQFLTIAIGPANGDDGAKLKREVEWITDHIKGEGY